MLHTVAEPVGFAEWLHDTSWIRIVGCTVSMHACVPDLEHASGLVGFSLCPDLKGVPLSVSCSGPCTNAGAVLQLFFVFFLVCISLNLVSRDFHAAMYAIVSCIMILLIIFEWHNYSY